MSWLSDLFGGGGDSGSDTSGEDLARRMIEQYSYRPQYTGQTEARLYDLFQRLTGQGGGGVNALPFDIGLPTTGLYDSLTRGISEDYLGTPGGPEGGRIADLKAYYNNLGVPEQALNAERLANRDLNNSLLDKAALINESQKDRLTNILGTGTNLGQNLYNMNLGQHRFNAGLGMQGGLADITLQDSINRANQDSLNALLTGAAYLGGSYLTGNPAGGAAASKGTEYLLNRNQNAPTAVQKSGGTKSGIASLLGGS